MSGIPSSLYQRCRKILLECSEFDSDDSLRAVFITDELYPFRNRLPSAADKSARVDACLDFLVDRRLRGDQPVLPRFLAALRDRYQPGDALHDELAALASTARTPIASPEHPLPEWKTSAEDFLDRYRKQIAEMCAYLDPWETPLPQGMGVRVELRDIYTRLEDPSRHTLSISDALIRMRPQRLYVSGASGAGKSVLLRYLTQLYANRQAHNKLWLPKSEDAVLPILFKLRRCTEPEGLWEQILGQVTRGILPSQAQLVSGLVSGEVVEGRVFLFLDGLDEVPDLEWRRRIVETVEHMIGDYPGLRVILTSRPMRRLEYVHGLSRLDMLPLSWMEIDKFIKRWLAALAYSGILSESGIEERRTELLKRIDQDPNLLELAGNPFSLTVLVLLIACQGLSEELPNSWLRLLDQYMDFYWWWETERRGLPSPSMGKDTALRCLYLVCYWQLVSPRRSQEVQQKLSDFLRDFFGMAPASASEGAEEVLSFWFNAGLLGPEDFDARLQIKHTLVQEYGVAQSLALLPKQDWIHSEEAHILPEWKRAVRWASIIRSKG